MPTCSLSNLISSCNWAFSAQRRSTEALSSSFSLRTATISALTAVMSARSLRFSDESLDYRGIRPDLDDGVADGFRDGNDAFGVLGGVGIEFWAAAGESDKESCRQYGFLFHFVWTYAV